MLQVHLNAPIYVIVEVLDALNCLLCTRLTKHISGECDFLFCTECTNPCTKHLTRCIRCIVESTRFSKLH